MNTWRKEFKWQTKNKRDRNGFKREQMDKKGNSMNEQIEQIETKGSTKTRDKIEEEKEKFSEKWFEENQSRKDRLVTRDYVTSLFSPGVNPIKQVLP